MLGGVVKGLSDDLVSEQLSERCALKLFIVNNYRRRPGGRQLIN